MGIAVFLSFLIAGVGQIYVGDVKRGLLFLVVEIALGSIIYSSSWLVYFDVLLVPIVILVGFMIFNMYDAYKLAKRHNEWLAHTAQPR